MSSSCRTLWANSRGLAGHREALGKRTDRGKGILPRSDASATYVLMTAAHRLSSEGRQSAAILRRSGW
jgi:hypothetical protein